MIFRSFKGLNLYVWVYTNLLTYISCHAVFLLCAVLLKNLMTMTTKQKKKMLINYINTLNSTWVYRITSDGGKISKPPKRANSAYGWFSNISSFCHYFTTIPSLKLKKFSVSESNLETISSCAFLKSFVSNAFFCGKEKRDKLSWLTCRQENWTGWCLPAGLSHFL